MTEFKAGQRYLYTHNAGTDTRSGRIVTIVKDQYVHVEGYVRAKFDDGVIGAFFPDELSAELSKVWRYNDHIVVYPETRDDATNSGSWNNTPGRGVTVLDETPLPKIYTRWENRPEVEGDEITAAARAYWEAHEPNPVIKEAKVRGDYVRFAYQLRYNDSAVWLAKYTKADIDAALPVIDRLALKASE